MESSIAPTFAEGFLEAFPVNVSEDVMWLPVEVSECQLAEELIAATNRRRHQMTTHNKWPYQPRIFRSVSTRSHVHMPVVQVTQK